MRLISALLCFCLTFNVMAASGTVQELERALDDYQYALTVEWDQKDASFMTAKTEAFYATLSDLMNKGMTKEEVLDLAAKKSKNVKEFEALKAQMSLVAANANTSTDLAQAITTNSKNMYSTGASWEGGAVLITVGIFVLIGAAVAYSIWYDSKHECVATAPGQQCGYISQYPGGPQIYNCWPTTYCTEYVKK